MGTRGPIPKRSDQRRRRNADSRPNIVEIPGRGPVEIPRARTTLPARARKLYDSLTASGQAQFYEPSDWQYALLMAEAVAAFMARPSAMMLSAIDTMAGKLLITEGDRRRARLELAASGDDDDQGDAQLLAMADFRKLAGVDDDDQGDATGENGGA